MRGKARIQYLFHEMQVEVAADSSKISDACLIYWPLFTYILGTIIREL